MLNNIFDIYVMKICLNFFCTTEFFSPKFHYHTLILGLDKLKSSCVIFKKLKLFEHLHLIFMKLCNNYTKFKLLSQNLMNSL